MKTLNYFIAGITLNILLLSGCDPGTIGKQDNTCYGCSFLDKPPYELLLEKKSPYSGFNVITSTLVGDFTYPVIVNWYNVNNETRVLKKADTLTSSSWNKSYYQSERTATGHFRVECEVIMKGGQIISKSIDY